MCYIFFFLEIFEGEYWQQFFLRITVSGGVVLGLTLDVVTVIPEGLVQ